MEERQGRPGGLLRRARVGSASALVGLLVAGCSVGTGTLRIADAEDEIVAIAEAVVRDAGLTVGAPVRAAPLEQCELRSGGAGLRTRVEVRGVLPDGPGALTAAFDAAASVLVARGLALVESGVPGTLLGQRDGMTVTVASDGPTIQLDALTGCRPR
jgi:hypothetical protein